MYLYRVELRCIVAIIRHGDRTPKQKLKMEVHHEKLAAEGIMFMSKCKVNIDVLIRFYDFFEKHGGKRKGRLKLKKPSHLQVALAVQLCMKLECNCYIINLVFCLLFVCLSVGLVAKVHIHMTD